MPSSRVARIPGRKSSRSSAFAPSITYGLPRESASLSTGSRALLPVERLADSRGLQYVIDGSNTDDLDDFRPGMRAARELGVRSPLQEVGLTKSEIRLLSERIGLRTWDKPAVACLSSRFAYGDPITVEKLRQVAAAESAVRALGFSGFRVRHHDDIARLEVSQDQFAHALECAEELVGALRDIGYQHAVLDLAGYRSGSSNEVLNARLKSRGLRRPGAL